MESQFWRPDQETRSSISRGYRLEREYRHRKKIEYALIRLERLIKMQQNQSVLR